MAAPTTQPDSPPLRVLVADDDAAVARLLVHLLERWGYRVTVVTDGGQAAAQLLGPEPPDLAIVDWMMPALTGPEVCRQLRQSPGGERIYVLMVTAQDSRESIVSGLDAGADDYLTKPFNNEELRARMQVGSRIVRLQHALAKRVRQLEETLLQVRTLRGLLPICSYCKRVRNDENYWEQVDQYVAEHTDAQFSHGICPECYSRFMADFGGSADGGGT